MRVVIGIDGGGTRTRAVVVDEEGRRLGRAESAGAVVHSKDPRPAVNAVLEAARAAADAAGVSLPVSGMWAGLAGAGAREGRLAVSGELVQSGLAERVVVGTDVEAAFHDAFRDGPGILLIAGTGSVAWGRGPTREVIRVGGWGERLGDEGSGFAIGTVALRAVVRAHDGRGEPTSLTARTLECLGLEATEALVGWAAGATKGDVAALVPVVVAAAAEGDAVAENILHRASSDLAVHVDAVLERTGPWPEPPPLVLWGGLLQEGGPLRHALERTAAKRRVRLIVCSLDPAMGAARLALAALPRNVDGI